MKLNLKCGVSICAVLLLSACGSNNRNDHGLYYWGNYTDVVYSYYEENGDYAKQEAALLQIIAGAKESGKQVGPGVYGQFGLVQLKQGKNGEARESFRQEQTLYPESGVFMQFLQKTKK